MSRNAAVHGLFYKVSARMNKSRLNEIRRSIVKNRLLYILLVPMVAYFLLFQYKPLYGLQIAFKDYSIWKGIQDSPWVGFKNFAVFFNGPHFGRILLNTLTISILKLIIQFPLPIILALLFNEVRSLKFRRFAQTATYMPHFISSVVIAGIVINFLSPGSGIINIIIEKLGGSRIYFLIKPEWFRPVFILMDIWKETGFSSIIYIAALSGINTELYQSAALDGAGRLKQIWHVTIPGILPTIVIMLILSVGTLLDVGFETIILLYQPATYETADVISTYVYRTGLENAQYDLAAAVGLFNSVVALILVAVSNKISKMLTENSLW